MRYVVIVLAAAISVISAHSNIEHEARAARAIAAGSGSYQANADYGGTGTMKSNNIIVGKPGSQPAGQSPITAAANSLPLGAKCSDSRQCAHGADCSGQTSFTIRECGNFNAACKTSAQCAYNACQDGLCNGIQKPSANATSPSQPTGSSYTYRPSPSASATGVYRLPNTTVPIVPFTGDASMATIASGLAALFFGVIAWIA